MEVARFCVEGGTVLHEVGERRDSRVHLLGVLQPFFDEAQGGVDLGCYVRVAFQPPFQRAHSTRNVGVDPTVHIVSEDLGCVLR